MLWPPSGCSMGLAFLLIQGATSKMERRVVDIPPKVPELVTRKALSGSVNCRKAGNLLDARKTPATPRPKPAKPPPKPPLRVSL